MNTEPIQRFPKISRLSHVVKRLPSQKNLPEIVTFTGTVKLHGTNIGFSQEDEGSEIRVQSRNRYLSKEFDNAGSCVFLEEHLCTFKAIFESIRNNTGHHGHILLFGELAGKDIHDSNVGIAVLDKFVAFFDVVFDKTRRPDVLEMIHGYEDDNIYSIRAFPTYEIKLNRKHPDGTEADAFAEEVGQDCPVARQLHAPGGGEGIMWVCAHQPENPSLWFKSKCYQFCLAHDECPSEPKVLETSRSPANLKAYAKEFAIAYTTSARVKQGIHEITQNKRAFEGKDMRELLTWTANDVLAEEAQDCQKDTIDYIRGAVKTVAAAHAKAFLKK